MKSLDHFKEIIEQEKPLDYENLDKLTVTKDGKTTVYTSSSNTTVEDAEADKDETDIETIDVDEKDKEDK